LNHFGNGDIDLEQGAFLLALVRPQAGRVGLQLEEDLMGDQWVDQTVDQWEEFLPRYLTPQGKDHLMYGVIPYNLQCYSYTRRFKISAVD
jgi:hypothetical protein